MIKKRLTFQLVNATPADFEIWKSKEKEINMIAINHNIVRSNRLDDDVKHTTSVDIATSNESNLLQAIIDIARFHEKHLSGIDVRCTQQKILDNTEVSFVIGSEQLELATKAKKQLKEAKTLLSKTFLENTSSITN